MPPDLSLVANEISVAFFIYNLLSDRVEGMGGTYLGKDFAPLETLYNIYDVSDRELITTFIFRIQQTHTKSVNEELERKRKIEERKSKVK